MTIKIDLNGQIIYFQRPNGYFIIWLLSELKRWLVNL